MNVLFLTIGRFESIEAHSIYIDLLRCFRNNNHNVYVVAPFSSATTKKTELVKEEGTSILHIKIDNLTKSKNLIKKGLAQLSLESKYKHAIKKYFSCVKFDLVLYSTPPITLNKAITYIKKRDGAKTYLLLKDIFPQNAVDIGLLKKTGIKGLIYKYFRKKEKKLYEISDKIGCMSQANVDYILNHNSEVDSSKVEVCPNSIDVVDKSVDTNTRNKIRNKYNIPLDKKVFLYGGNLGKPQGISFLIKCLRLCGDLNDAFFLIVGDGTEFHLLQDFLDVEKLKNVKLMRILPKDDYDAMVGACDVGLIFLDYRFTIPNFPSRLLGYMQAKLPVLVCTDEVTDVGIIAKREGFGWKCKSNDVAGFYNLVKYVLKENLCNFGNKSFVYLKDNYSVEEAYKIIIEHCDE